MRWLRDRDSNVAFLGTLILFYSLVGIGYLVLPVAHDLGRVLLGSSLLPLDVLMNAALLEWGYHALFSSTHHLFDWIGGFPFPNTLATNENVVGWQVIYYPLRASGISVAGAYNACLLFSFLAGGIGTALLSRRLGANRWGAGVAGLVFAYGPFHLNNMMDIQIMSVCWSPYAILFLDRYMEKPATGDAIGLLATSILSVLSGIYVGVFLGIILALYALLTWSFGRHKADARVFVRLALIGFLALVAVSPLAVPYVRFLADHGSFSSSPITLAGLSMEWVAPLRTPLFQKVWSGTILRWSNHWDGQPAFFGIVGLSLIVLGIIDLRRRNASRAVMLTLVSLSFIAYLLALGPLYKTGGSGPSRIVTWVPMPGRLWLLIPGIRWPSRFFFFAWLCGSLLAGFGISAIQRRVGPRWRSLVAISVTLLLLIEYWPARSLAGDSLRVPMPLAMSDAYPFLAREGDRGGVIELPTSDTSPNHAPLVGLYLYGAAGHLRRVVALHGRRIPALTDSLIAAGNILPQEAGRIFLFSHGVTRVVVHRVLGNPATNASLIAALIAARFQVLFNGREAVVFALAPLPIR
jgi:hypothetical protein